MTGLKKQKNPKEEKGFFRPFSDLKNQLKERAVPVKSLPQHIESHKPEWSEEDKQRISGCDDKELFEHAMADVIPLPGRSFVQGKQPAKPEKTNTPCPNTETLRKLRTLVEDGKGFQVSCTPEYIEGCGYGVHPRVAGRLHRGDYSVEDHIDLHGMGVADAQDAFFTFISRAVRSGKRNVLVVHGRGLSSPFQPVLKNQVQKWLTRGPLRKWVLAYASARSCDGGAGATYVLLRQKPVTKKRRKQKKQ